MCSYLDLKIIIMKPIIRTQAITVNCLQIASLVEYYEAIASLYVMSMLLKEKHAHLHIYFLINAVKIFKFISETSRRLKKSTMFYNL